MSLTMELRSMRSDLSKAAEQRLELLHKSQSVMFPRDVAVCGLDFEVRSGVFSPEFFESTELLCDMYPFERGGVVLDMGCGCGAFAILAARRGAREVHAVDIVEAAVENARSNVLRHGVERIVTSFRSDLFASLPPKQTYDYIFWNSPWVFVPA